MGELSQQAILQYKELACADIKNPIVVIFPDGDAERDFYVKVGKDDSVTHAEKMFGRQFESYSEMMEFASTLDTIEKVVSELKDKGRALFEVGSEKDIYRRIQVAIEGDFGQVMGTKHPGQMVASHAIGRMAMSNEILIKGRRLRATPIISAPTSWTYLTWKLEYDTDKTEMNNRLESLHILRGLQSLSENEMQWLGKVPTDALIELRKTGALDEIREILGKGVAEVAGTNPSNFHRTADKVFDNIDHAFEEHKKKIKELSSKKWKFAGTDIASWLVVGTMEVTAAATGLPVWGLATIAANQVFDIPKIKDIPASIKELAEESKKLKLSPVGMFFSCSNDKP